MKTKIAIFDQHHQVLSAWAELRRELPEAPEVWTLDYHNDTISCFRGNEPPPEIGDWRDPLTVTAAVEHLRHDEHFDWALRSGLIAHAEIFSYTAPPFAPAHPEMAVRNSGEFPGQEVILNEPEKFRPQAEKILESDFLNSVFYRHMPGDKPFILDIDCDSILCGKALAPRDRTLFDSWLKNAALVTISRESEWVRVLRLPNEKITGESIAGDLKTMHDRL